MGKIDELIKQMCPEGVKTVLLGDILTICRGASPRPIQNFLTEDEDGIHWIKIGDVSPQSKYITLSSQEKVWEDEIVCYEDKELISRSL